MTETKKANPNGMVRLTVILFAITAIVALLLGLVNYVTADRIQAIKEQKTADALLSVIDADAFEPVDYTGSESVTALYGAKKGADACGYAVQVSVSGSQGMIDMVVGVDLSGAVTGVSIVDMSETSGLGSKADDPAWLGQFTGAGEPQAVNKDGGSIDALTGATVTSRAVTLGVNIALEAAAAAAG